MDGSLTKFNMNPFCWRDEGLLLHLSHIVGPNMTMFCTEEMSSSKEYVCVYFLLLGSFVLSSEIFSKQEISMICK